MSRRRRSGGAHGSDERGLVVLAPGLVAVAVVTLIGITQVGAATIARARADTAADAAALAAADELALGASTTAAVEAARSVAVDNGAELVACDCAGAHAEVRAAVDAPPLLRLLVGDAVVGVARAEVQRDAPWPAP